MAIMNKSNSLTAWQKFWLLVVLLWVTGQLLEPTFATPTVRFVFSILSIVLTFVAVIFIVILVVAVAVLLFRPAALEQFVVPRLEMLRRVVVAVRNEPSDGGNED